MLNEGIFLMVVGMGVVFSFLTIMVIAMTITAKVIEILNKYFPEPIETVPAKASSTISKVEQEIAVAIAVAKNFTK